MATGPRSSDDGRVPIGPVDGRVVPRFAGSATFARLPVIGEVRDWAVAVLGVPFDAGTSYRPGARFGPQAVRQASRLVRAYHPDLDVQPFAAVQMVDAGDVPCTPFSIMEALGQVEDAARTLTGDGGALVAIGGDHTIALPLLRAAASRHGPVALVHLDAHLDTWDTYFGAPYTHGTPFRRAWEENLLLADRCAHVGTRASLYDPSDLTEDDRMRFFRFSTMDVAEQGVASIGAALRDRVGAAPVYVSIDIDVLDPAHAPGTGTPEPGGLSTRELRSLLTGLDGVNVIGADVVEVAPAYDHAEITALAAAAVAYDCLALLAKRRMRDAAGPRS
jgi:guanidinobutyrase / D-arginase